MYRWLFFALLCGTFPVLTLGEDAGGDGAADLIVHHAKVVTVDGAFTIAEAVAIKGDRILAVGDNKTVLRHRGPATKLIDARGGTVLPGLYDSHVHPVGAATSELVEP